MPVLILLGIFGVWGAVSLHESCAKQAPAYSSSEIEQIMSEMIGKSEKECRKILRQHRNR